MKNNNLLFLCVLSLFVGLAGCATSSKTVTTGYSVKPVSQLDKAKAAFSRKDYALAAKLLEPLAADGQSYAQYALGYMHYNGMGVPRNRILANQLLNASASNGNKNAIKALRLLSPTSSSVPGATTNTPPPPEVPPSVVSEELVSEEVASNVAKSQPEKVQLTEDPASSLEMNGTDELMVEQKTPAEPEIQDPMDEITAEVTDKPHSLTENEKWIVAQPDTNYTIQLVVSGKETKMQQFIVDNNLEDIAIYYKSKNSSADLFILIQGSFESFSQATKTIASMPPEIQETKPWVRSIAVIKESILAN